MMIWLCYSETTAGIREAGDQITRNLHLYNATAQKIAHASYLIEKIPLCERWRLIDTIPTKTPNTMFGIQLWKQREKEKEMMKKRKRTRTGNTKKKDNKKDK